MSRKQKLSPVERERRRDRRQQEQQDLVVEDTVALLGCSVDTANDLFHQAEDRLLEADVAVAFVRLAREVWGGRPGRGQDLTPLLDELAAELERHAQTVESIAERLHPLAHGEHQHLEDNAVSPERVRLALFPPPEKLRKRIGGQIPTDSGGR